ncbi:hypothetical protein MKX03_022656, partial [Papaver bracteatum]
GDGTVLYIGPLQVKENTTDTVPNSTLIPIHTLFSFGFWSVENLHGSILLSIDLQLGVPRSMSCGSNKRCFEWKSLLLRV